MYATSLRASFCYAVLYMHQLFTSILVHPYMSLGGFMSYIENLVFLLLPRSIEMTLASHIIIYGMFFVIVKATVNVVKYNNM